MLTTTKTSKQRIPIILKVRKWSWHRVPYPSSITLKKMTQINGVCRITTLFGAYLTKWFCLVHQSNNKTKIRGWADAEMILSLVLLNLAGGDCITDIERLERDAGLRTLLMQFAALPKYFKKIKMKTLRFHIIPLPGRIIHHELAAFVWCLAKNSRIGIHTSIDHFFPINLGIQKNIALFFYWDIMLRVEQICSASSDNYSENYRYPM